MTHFAELAKLNTENAAAITGDSNLDFFAADLVLRNAAVATDRLRPASFFSLSAHTIEAVHDAVEVAKQLAPLQPADLERFPDESTVDHQYRVSVWQPLHALQGRVNSGDLAKYSSVDAHRLKCAVMLSSIAFESILAESANNAAIIETEQYFWGNTEAAAGRIARAAHN